MIEKKGICPKCNKMTSFSQTKVNVNNPDGENTYVFFIKCDFCGDTILVRDSFDRFIKNARQLVVEMDKLFKKIEETSEEFED